MIYSIVSIICIALMVLILGLIIYKFITLNRAEKIEYVRNFKKGKCAIIYLISVPLFFIADIFAEKTVGVAIFNAISYALQLVVLKYNMNSALILVNKFYAIALYMCCTLVLLNAIMITISLLHQSLWNYFFILRFKNAKDNKCIIIGENDKSELIYSTCNDSKIIIDVLKTSDCDNLFNKNINYKSFSNKKRQTQWLEKDFVKLLKKNAQKNQNVNVIINKEDEDTNIYLCSIFLKIINKISNEGCLKNLNIFVYGDRDNQEIYAKYVENSKGCLHYVNAHHLVAIDFMYNFAITKYMDGSQLDYSTATLKEDVDVNVSFIGFGKANQQIFLSMVANNQFIVKDSKGKVVLKPVNYHFFDLRDNRNQINLNNYFRYKELFFDGDKIKANTKDYLELPPLPSKEFNHFGEINNNDFYTELYATISKGNKDINYIIISLGDDYKNINVANRIALRIKDLKLANVYLFVRVKNEGTLSNCKLLLDRNIYTFGSNLNVAYKYSNIIKEAFTQMAIKKSFVYDIENEFGKKEVSGDEYLQSINKWYTKLTEVERDSNLYCCLSIKSKLNMMGLDLVNIEEEGEPLSFEEYLDIYAKDDKPTFVKNTEDKIAISYDLNCKESLRYNLACQEHLRWNAFLISKGFIPATINDILSERNNLGKFTNGKDYLNLKHGCLTTFDGLKEYRKLISTRDNQSEKDKDVIKYDYQVLDGAWWLAKQSGFKIIVKKQVNYENLK